MNTATTKKEDITYDWANFLLGLSEDNQQEIRKQMHPQDKALWDKNNSLHLHEMHKILIGINVIVKNISIYYPSEKAKQIETAIHISTDSLYASIGVQRISDISYRHRCMNDFLQYSGLICGSIETIAPTDKVATNILIECNTMLMGSISMAQSIFNQMEQTEKQKVA